MADDLIDALTRAVDDLLSCPLQSLSAAEITDLHRAVEVQARRLSAVGVRLTAVEDRRGVAAERGAPSTAAMVRDLLHVSPTEARRRAGLAADLGDRVALSGEPLPPIFPSVAAAFRAGEISDAHAEIITGTVNRLRDVIEAEHGVAIAEALLAQARDVDPPQLRVLARDLVDHYDPDGAEPADRRHDRDREVRLRPNADGSGDLRGRLTPDALAVWQTIFDCLAVPRPAEPVGANADGQGGGPVLRDTRTHAQRVHDALRDAGIRLLQTGDLPDTAGVTTTVVITIRADHDASEGDASEGDASDGDASDGDASDGDASDGDGFGPDRFDSDESDSSESGVRHEDARPADAYAGLFPEPPPLGDDLSDDLGQCSSSDRTNRTATGSNAADAAGAEGGSGVRTRRTQRPGPVIRCDGHPLHLTSRGGRTAHGNRISLSRIGHLMCDGVYRIATVGPNGAVLNLSRGRRLATPSQRIALAARDGGCSFPHCTRPATWCQVHHVKAWRDGGTTDIENLTLICGHHHRVVDTNGWTCTMRDGVPYWTAPEWLDPDQRPQRNIRHHLERLLPWPLNPSVDATASG